MNNSSGSPDSKKVKIIVILATVTAVAAILMAVLISFGFRDIKLRKYINLGQKYISEMNYEEAIVSFENALEIDPMSAEAYLGIADAYIGIANECYDANDFDGAIMALNSAKDKLKKGIEILTKYAENNSGIKADEAKAGVEKLTSKLEEVESKISQIEDAMNSPETSEIGPTESIDDEKYADLPRIYVQPLMDELNNVWGKNWREWTVDDFIATFGLTQKNEQWTNKENPKNEFVKRATTSSDNSVSFGDSYVLSYDSSSLCWFVDETIGISSEDTFYTKTITSTIHEVNSDGLYSFCLANGITSAEGAAAYFGIDEFTDDQGILVMTEYGPGCLYYTVDEKYGADLSINITEDNHLWISFGYHGHDEIGMTDFHVSIKQGW